MKKISVVVLSVLFVFLSIKVNFADIAETGEEYTKNIPIEIQQELKDNGLVFLESHPCCEKEHKGRRLIAVYAREKDIEDFKNEKVKSVTGRALLYFCFIHKNYIGIEIYDKDNSCRPPSKRIKKRGPQKQPDIA